MTTRSMIGSCVIQKHTQLMLQLLNLVYAVCTWKSGRLNQIVDVPVQQIEKERVDESMWRRINRYIKDAWRRINWYLRNALSNTLTSRTLNLYS